MKLKNIFTILFTFIGIFIIILINYFGLFVWNPGKEIILLPLISLAGMGYLLGFITNEEIRK